MPQENTFSAVICELDPLHLGHRLILSEAAAPGLPVVCLMSGSFVQRGAPAMLDKWERARLALLSGADLVAELPLTWALAGAERFALGGVALAAALGQGLLYFGSEVPDVTLLMSIARALLSEDFSRALESCPESLGFASRRQLAVERLLGPEAAGAMGFPNANLGIEYCKAILKLRAKLAPVAIERVGAGHNEGGVHDGYVSGSELRRRVFAGESISGLVPECTLKAVEEARKAGHLANISYLERAMLCKLRSMEDLSALPDLSGGLEYRLSRAAGQAGSLTELYALTKSRRVSHARVRRLALCAFLGVSGPLLDLPPYLRVLGATQRGLELLRRSSLPVVVRSSEAGRLPPKAQEVFRLEALAGDLYGLATPTPRPSGRDHTQKLVKL